MKIVLRCMYKSPQSGFFILRNKLRRLRQNLRNQTKIESDSTKTKTKMNIYTNKRFFLVTTAITVGIVGLLFFITPVISSPTTLLETEVNSSDLVLLTNEMRDVKHLNPLTNNDKLIAAATSKAKHLIKYDYFSHNSPDGKQFSEWIIESGYRFQIIGENLAIGFNTNKEVMKAWMDSPAHRNNILNKKYNEIGIVVLEGNVNGEMETIVVQIFGSQPTLQLSENFSHSDYSYS